ncbi:hypothetical protein ACFO0N_19325 [Halobium salinum]|uniref:Uncharacterized protein n=1 Tax=Halobium salinum TaxID=1364940 RepID=A0ABD5PH43_9EURY|nr:hypothetical protein [Halobium salinum]
MTVPVVGSTAPTLLHGGAPATAPPGVVVLVGSVLAVGLLAWGGTLALDAVVARLF